MWALVEGLWYSFLIILKVVFWPLVIILGLVVILRIIAKVRSIIKNNKK